MFYSIQPGIEFCWIQFCVRSIILFLGNHYIQFGTFLCQLCKKILNHKTCLYWAQPGTEFFLASLRNIFFVPGHKEWLLRIWQRLMLTVQISMITDYLCLFLGLCFTSVCPLPVIFICGVNCQSFFPSVNKGGNYTLFLNLSVPGRSFGVPRARSRCSRVFSTLTQTKQIKHTGR